MSCNECVYATFIKDSDKWICRDCHEYIDEPYEDNECDAFQYPYESCGDCPYYGYQFDEDDDGKPYTHHWCDMHGETVEDPNRVAPFCFIHSYLATRKLPCLDYKNHPSLHVLYAKLKEDYWRTSNVRK